jgi:hypothetical protein
MSANNFMLNGFVPAADAFNDPLGINSVGSSTNPALTNPAAIPYRQSNTDSNTNTTPSDTGFGFFNSENNAGIIVVILIALVYFKVIKV